MILHIIFLIYHILLIIILFILIIIPLQILINSLFQFIMIILYNDQPNFIILHHVILQYLKIYLIHLSFMFSSYLLLLLIHLHLHLNLLLII